jgi:hypothetical protein
LLKKIPLIKHILAIPWKISKSLKCCWVETTDTHIPCPHAIILH